MSSEDSPKLKKLKKDFKEVQPQVAIFAGALLEHIGEFIGSSFYSKLAEFDEHSKWKLVAKKSTSALECEVRDLKLISFDSLLPIATVLLAKGTLGVGANETNCVTKMRSLSDKDLATKLKAAMGDSQYPKLRLYIGQLIGPKGWAGHETKALQKCLDFYKANIKNATPEPVGYFDDEPLGASEIYKWVGGYADEDSIVHSYIKWVATYAPGYCGWASEYRKNTPQLLMMLNSLLEYEKYKKATPFLKALTSELQPFLIEIGKENLGAFPRFITTFLKHKTVKKYCSVEDPRELTLVESTIKKKSSGTGKKSESSSSAKKSKKTIKSKPKTTTELDTN